MNYQEACRTVLLWVKDHLPWAFVVQSSEQEFSDGGWLILSCTEKNLTLSCHLPEDTVEDFQLEEE
jgi:hypothetical protein